MKLDKSFKYICTIYNRFPYVNKDYFKYFKIDLIIHFFNVYLLIGLKMTMPAMFILYIIHTIAYVHKIFKINFQNNILCIYTYYIITFNFPHIYHIYIYINKVITLIGLKNNNYYEMN